MQRSAEVSDLGATIASALAQNLEGIGAELAVE
jgi:hypothetical protein